MQMLFKVFAVAGSAMFAGVMLAIGMILGGYWKGMPPAEFLDWLAKHGDLIQRVIPLVVVPTVVGLAGALSCDWRQPAARGLWLGAAVCIVAVLGLTMVYFAPTNAAFATKAVALDQVSAKLDTWLLLHYLRVAVALTAPVLGILAITR